MRYQKPEQRILRSVHHLQQRMLLAKVGEPVSEMSIHSQRDFNEGRARVWRKADTATVPFSILQSKLRGVGRHSDWPSSRCRDGVPWEGSGFIWNHNNGHCSWATTRGSYLLLLDDNPAHVEPDVLLADITLKDWPLTKLLLRMFVTWVCGHMQPNTADHRQKIARVEWQKFPQQQLESFTCAMPRREQSCNERHTRYWIVYAHAQWLTTMKYS